MDRQHDTPAFAVPFDDTTGVPMDPEPETPDVSYS